MANNSTNINKTTNHISRSLTEHNKTTTYDVGNLGSVYMQIVDSSSDEIFVTKSINIPLDSVSTLTWFIGNTYYWNVQLLNDLILIKLRLSSLGHRCP